MNRADVGTSQFTDTPLHTIEGSFIGKFSGGNLDWALFSKGIGISSNDRNALIETVYFVY